MTRRYPLEPFMAVTGWSMVKVREQAPCNGSEYRLRIAEGVTERTADRLAVAAGFHPFDVWPEMVDDAASSITRSCAAEGCPETFMVRTVGKGGRNRRWCSDTCRARESMRAYRRTDKGAEANRAYAAAYRAYLKHRVAA